MKQATPSARAERKPRPQARPGAPRDDKRNELFRYAEASRAEFEDLLKEFVEVPTVSVDPTKKRAIHEGVKLATDTIRRFGGEAAVLETPGAPSVHGRWGNDPSRPTVRSPGASSATAPRWDDSRGPPAVCRHIALASGTCRWGAPASFDYPGAGREPNPGL